MSMSTTSTATYILVKYSRAYPTHGSGTQELDVEWQHFTNPTVRLILDIKKSGNGELESYRVRILWSLNAVQDGMDIDQRDVVFEDLELLSFSSMPSQSLSAHGLPLKAVYRESVVGIRYMHPKVVPLATSAAYRRFQMNFQSSKDASSFIDAIRHVCPCKVNPPTQPALARASTMAPAPSPRTPASVSSSRMPPPPLPVASGPPGTTLRASATMAVDQRRPVNDSSPSSQRMAISSLIAATGSTNHARTEPVAAASGLSLITAPGTHSAISAGTVAASLPIALGPVATLSTSSPHTTATNGIITPSSGAYTLSTSAGTPQTVPFIPPTIDELAPSAVPTPETPSLQPESQTMDVDTPGDTPAASLLPKITGIYDLAGTELESLVAGVIREDGFVKLLENLDSMWRVKILLGQ